MSLVKSLSLAFVFDKISVNGIRVNCEESFCIYIREEIDPQNVHCGRQKAIDVLRELARVGLIEIKRQGCGKPNLIYPRVYKSDARE